MKKYQQFFQIFSKKCAAYWKKLYFCTRWIEWGLALENDIVKEPDKLNVIGFYTMWRQNQAFL